jgi:hypothetical protein
LRETSAQAQVAGALKEFIVSSDWWCAGLERCAARLCGYDAFVDRRLNLGKGVRKPQWRRRRDLGTRQRVQRRANIAIIVVMVRIGIAGADLQLARMLMRLARMHTGRDPDRLAGRLIRVDVPERHQELQCQRKQRQRTTPPRA